MIYYSCVAYHSKEAQHHDWPTIFIVGRKKVYGPFNRLSYGHMMTREEWAREYPDCEKYFVHFEESIRAMQGVPKRATNVQWRGGNGTG